MQRVNKATATKTLAARVLFFSLICVGSAFATPDCALDLTQKIAASVGEVTETIAVPKNVCLNVAQIREFHLGDVDTWRSSVVARDGDGKTIIVKITPIRNAGKTLLYVTRTADGHVAKFWLEH